MLQILSIRQAPAEFWGAIAAVATGAVFFGKKFLSRQKPKPEYITRAEFHEGLDETRERIGVSYLALSAKLDANHKEVLAVIENQGANFERRLDRLESGLARVDERTKL